MITNIEKHDIFEASPHHILFAVNKEGLNDAGFAGQVADLWPGLNGMALELGQTASFKHPAVNSTFHALCVHHLGVGGWKETPFLVSMALSGLQIGHGQRVGMVMAGSGPVGQAQGADVLEILNAVAKSGLKIEVYYR